MLNSALNRARTEARLKQLEQLVKKLQLVQPATTNPYTGGIVWLHTTKPQAR